MPLDPPKGRLRPGAMGRGVCIPDGGAGAKDDAWYIGRGIIGMGTPVGQAGTGGGTGMAADVGLCSTIGLYITGCPGGGAPVGLNIGW